MVAPISPAMLAKIMTPPAASLRASAEAFDKLGRQFDADFSRRMARAAERDPHLYITWANGQADRVRHLQENAS